MDKKIRNIIAAALFFLTTRTFSFASLADEPSIEGALGGINMMKAITLFILGLATITAIVFFILNIVKLGAAGDNEKERKEAVKAILVSGLCFAAFGSLGFVIAFLRGALGATFFKF